MKAFQDYHSLILQFHRALANLDIAALHRLLSIDAVATLDRSVPDRQSVLPFSEDIDVQGISVEGNGAVTVVTYTNKVELTGEVLTLRIDVADVGGQLRILQPLPTIMH